MDLSRLFKLNKQKFVMVGGLPGSGKSTLCRQFVEAGYKLVCPDTNRGIIAAKNDTSETKKSQAEYEGDQSVSNDAWMMAYEQAKQYLRDGESVVFDALHQTRKARARTLNSLAVVLKGVPTYAVYVDSTLETCINRNLNRANDGGRYVPTFVIETKWRTQTLPLKEEGFHEVFVLSEVPEGKYNLPTEKKMFQDLFLRPIETVYTWHEQGILKDIFPSLDRAWDFSQDNQNHSKLLHDHMLGAAEAFKNKDQILFLSGLLHDVGKVDTKQYFAKMTQDYGEFQTGEKVILIEANQVGVIIRKQLFLGDHTEIVPHGILDVDQNAHFYDHNYVGAIMARRDLLMNGFGDDFADTVYRYILYHMDLPFRDGYKQQQLEKFVDRVTPKLVPGLVSIRYADKRSGAWKPEMGQFLQTLTKDLQAILDERSGGYVVSAT